LGFYAEPERERKYHTIEVRHPSSANSLPERAGTRTMWIARIQLLPVLSQLPFDQFARSGKRDALRAVPNRQDVSNARDTSK